MALATTTLASAVLAGDTVVNLTSATSVAAGRYMLVDQEVMRVVQSYVSGTLVGVIRGVDGTPTLAHKITANVTHGLPSDFALPGAQSAVTYAIADRPIIVTSVSVTSTLVLPPAGCDMRVILNGTTVITLTVPVPTKDMDGCNLVIVSNGAAAHVPTFTGGLGGAGSSYDAITNNATGQMALSVYAANGAWCIPQAPALTGTVTNITGGIA